jgi:prepilin-type N-terminal cleavage/methylation domain-containing protein
MRPSRSRQGFTLIELLVVVVILGILAALAIPKFQSTKGKAYASSMKSDLRNVASQQEQYFTYNGTYSNDLGLISITSSQGVTITIIEANGRGWSATSTHPSAYPMVCAVFYGQAVPVTPAITEGVIRCE